MPGRAKRQNGRVLREGGRLACACCGGETCGGVPLPPQPTVVAVTFTIIDARTGCYPEEEFFHSDVEWFPNGTPPSGAYLLTREAGWTPADPVPPDYLAEIPKSGAAYRGWRCNTSFGPQLFCDREQVRVRIGCVTNQAGTLTDYGLTINALAGFGQIPSIGWSEGAGYPPDYQWGFGYGHNSAGGPWTNEQRPGAWVIHEGETAISPPMVTPGQPGYNPNTGAHLQDVRYRIGWQTLAADPVSGGEGGGVAGIALPVDGLL